MKLNPIVWRMRRSRKLSLELLFVLLLFLTPCSSLASTDADADSSGVAAIEVASADADANADESRPLEPRYQPREPEEKSFYNGSYIFGMTRGVADSTIAPAGKAPLFLLTIPLDIVLLPFTIIGGLFG